jgi:esterase/lipase
MAKKMDQEQPEKKSILNIKILVKWLLGLLSGILVISLSIAIFLYFKPRAEIDVPKIQNQTFEQSQKQFDEIVTSRDDDQVNPVCKSKLLTHNQKTSKTIVLFHGFTNCPAQFDQLSKSLFEQGYNVYIPRIAHHGLRNTLTDDLENLKSFELADLVAESVQIATGLGDSITLFGLSGGGVLASFGGYYYPQVNSVFIASPMFAPGDLAGWQMPLILNLLEYMPSRFAWWDKTEKENVKGPTYAYPRYSEKGAYAFLGLANQLKKSIEQHQIPQNGKSLIFLTVENDPAVNNTYARNIVTEWAKNPNIKLISYEFDASKVPIHDFIDPNQTKQNISYTYPVVLKLLESLE